MSEDASWGDDPHGWNDLDTHLLVQESAIRRLRPFVLQDRLNWLYDGPGLLRIEGSVECAFGIAVEVAKLLELRDPGPMSRTIRYSYHAMMDGVPPRPILRYDNAAHFPNPPDAHHCHRFDWLTGGEAVVWIGRQHWPHLGDVIAEVRDWWFEIGIAADS